MTHTSAPPKPETFQVVIDTQVVMDWLVFRDARVQALVDAVVEGRVRWIGQMAMLDELRHVLGRGVAAAYAPDLISIEQHFAQHCHMVSDDCPPAVRLTCRDPDDQKFIDLAIAQKALYLFSRDRAVLALSKRARAFGLTIMNPDRWSLPDTASTNPALD